MYKVKINKQVLSLGKHESVVAIQYQHSKAFEVKEATDSQLDEIRKQSDVLVGTHTFYDERDETKQPLILMPYLYIIFENSSIQQLLMQQYSLQQISKNTYQPLKENPMKVAIKLQSEKGVLLSEPDLAAPIKSDNRNSIEEITAVHYANQWTFTNDGNATPLYPVPTWFVEDADANIPEAWQLMGEKWKGENVTIAIGDDSFNYLDHPDFDREDVIATFNSTDETPNVSDASRFHGTAVMGIVGANTSGNVVGVLPKCKKLLIRIDYVSTAHMEKILNFIRQHKSENQTIIFTNSWEAGHPFYVRSTAMDELFKQALLDNILILFAAGNGAKKIHEGSLADSPYIVSVGAVGSQGIKAIYSNSGCDLAGYSNGNGAGVTTADTAPPNGYNPEDYYTARFGGTSAATPLVAAIAGMALQLRPELTALQLREVLLASCKKLVRYPNDDSGSNEEIGRGAIDASAIIDKAMYYKSIRKQTSREMQINRLYGISLYRSFTAYRHIYLLEGNWQLRLSKPISNIGIYKGINKPDSFVAYHITNNADVLDIHVAKSGFYHIFVQRGLDVLKKDTRYTMKVVPIIEEAII